MNKCKHCKQEILRSCVVEKRSDRIQLKCTACKEEYDVPNTEEQVAVMQHENTKPFATESIFSRTQLGEGDLLEFRTPGCISVDHCGICLEVDHDNDAVVVIELQAGLIRNSVERRSVKVEELRNKAAILYRYKPLDCLPLEETIQRAKATAKGDEKTGACPDNNFFGNWCKTGALESLEQRQFSMLKALGTFISHPQRSLRELRNIGTGRDMPGYDASTVEREWSSSNEGWSSQKASQVEMERESSAVH